MSIHTNELNELPNQLSYVKYQYLAVCLVNILSICHGSAIGWLSPAIPALKSNETTLYTGPATVEEISWIGACFSVGALIGNVMYSATLRYAGLRRTMFALVPPNVLFWLSVLFARYPWHLYVGRTLAGISGGGLYLCVPMFVADIADRNIRGALGSFIMVFVSLGILLSFVAGTYLPFSCVPYVFIFLPVVPVIGLIFMPDTCQQLLARDRYADAERAFIFYRLGNRKEQDAAHQRIIKSELDALQLYQQMRATAETNTRVWDELLTAPAIKGILTGLCLTALNLFSGTLAMITYTTMIFKDSGSTVDADISSIIVAAVQVISVYVSSHLVDRLGRKTLLIASCAGAAFSTGGLGLFSYLHTTASDPDRLAAYNWLPLLLFSFYIVITCMGLLPLPFIILAEILPTEVRQTGSAICMMSISVFAFASLKCFPLVSSTWGLYTALWSCSGVCVLGVLFAIFVLRETKGKNLHEMSAKP